MSWLSSYLDSLGGVGKAVNAIGGPIANAAGSVVESIPVVGGIEKAVKGLGNAVPNGQNNGGSTPNVGGLTLADILKGAGAGIGAYTNQQDIAKQLAEREREFNVNNANQSTSQAAALQSQVNRAPMADKAQALLLARMGAPPTTFQPRDYTQGYGAIAPGQTAQGGPATQMAAGQTAAANYTPGSGGVNTDTLNLLLNRMKGNALAKSGMTS